MTVLGIANAGPDPLIDGIRSAVAQTAVELGLDTCEVFEPDQEYRTDILLLVGSPRYYGRFLDAPRRSHRIAWFGEPLPSLLSTRRAARPPMSGPVFAGTALVRRLLGPITRRPLPGRLRIAREGAAIAYECAANLSDARTCSSLVDEVVVTSRDRARVLAASGIQARVVPFGYHPANAGPIASDSADRDIAVATIGSALDARHLRRRRVFDRILPGLEALGPVAVLNNVWGRERDSVLRRTRILLDIQRVPGNFTGLRFLIAFASGAVLITEPLDDPHPFVSGSDHIEASAGRLIHEIATLLHDESTRRSIAAVAQERLRDELSMRTMLGRVLGCV